MWTFQCKILLKNNFHTVGNKAKGESQKACYKKKKARKITYVCVSGGRKCSFFRKFGMLFFLETHALRFGLLLYYRRYRDSS